MNDGILARIRAHALSKASPRPVAPASDAVVEEAESTLGFPLPPLLKACYVQIGNGGFGPGYGLVGLEGGASSDFGSLVETYRQLKSDSELLGKRWPPGLLPFCDWGCNTFSCVDCSAPDSPIYTVEELRVQPQGYTLETFFEMWLKGLDIRSAAPDRVVEREIVNPFTGKKTTIQGRRKE